MQAIWHAEVPDQRYMRLYDLEIQWPVPADKAKFVSSTSGFSDRMVSASLPSKLGYNKVKGFLKMPGAKLGDKRLL